MSREVYAYPSWRMPLGRRQDERRFIDDVVNDAQLNEAFRVQLLAQALVTGNKDYARIGDRPDSPSGLRKLVEGFLFRRRIAQIAQALNAGMIPNELRAEFQNNGYPLSPQASVEVIQTDDEWRVIDREKRFIIRVESGNLNVYGEERPLDCFFSSQISSYLSDDALGLLPLLPDPAVFPVSAWAIKLDFTLRKPYLSKDDCEFYILDNPVRKEWVFKVPYVAPSQWKGALRAAMVQELKWWWLGLSDEERGKDEYVEEFAKRRFRMTLLFGDEKGEEPGALKGLARFLDDLGGEKAAQLYRERVRGFFKKEEHPIHHRGWLRFYPTYFDRIGLEVINPHPRDTGAGKQPIYFESVPPGTKGQFVLLYVPLGEVTQEEARDDFRAVVQGIKAMFEKYGFGAKTSSGFGRAHVCWKEEEDAEVRPENLREEWDRIWRNDS